MAASREVGHQLFAATVLIALLGVCSVGGLVTEANGVKAYSGISHRSSPILPSEIEADCPNIDKLLSTQILSAGGVLPEEKNDVLVERGWLTPVLFLSLIVFGYAAYGFGGVLIGRLRLHLSIQWQQVVIVIGALLLSMIVGELILQSTFVTVLGRGWEIGINHAARMTFTVFMISAGLITAKLTSNQIPRFRWPAYSTIILFLIAPATSYLIANTLSPRIDLFQDYGKRFVVDPILHDAKIVDNKAIAIVTQVPGEGQADGAVDIVMFAFAPIACHKPIMSTERFHFGTSKLRAEGFLVPKIVAPTFEISPINDSPSSLTQVSNQGVEWAWRLRSNVRGNQNVRVSVVQVQKLPEKDAIWSDPVEVMWSDFGVDMRGSLWSLEQIATFISWIGALVGTITGVIVGILGIGKDARRH